MPYLSVPSLKQFVDKILYRNETNILFSVDSATEKMRDVAPSVEEDAVDPGRLWKDTTLRSTAVCTNFDVSHCPRHGMNAPRVMAPVQSLRCLFRAARKRTIEYHCTPLSNNGGATLFKIR